MKASMRLKSTPHVRRSLKTLVMATCLWMSASQVSHAELGQNLSIDIRALALGNAVTADPPGLSSIHYNPAGLTHIQGLQTDVQGVLANFDVSRSYSAPPGFNVFGYSDDPVVCNDAANNGISLCTDFKVGRSKVNGASLYIPVLKKMINLPDGVPLLAPLGGIGYHAPGSRITYATAFYAPLAAGFHQTGEDPGNFMGKSVAMERFTYLAPSSAYQVSDTLSVGGSIGLSYQAIAMDTDLRFPNDLVGVMRLVNENICAPFKQNSSIIIDLLLFGLCNAQQSIGPFTSLASMKVAVEQTVSPTYNLGILWEPRDDFSLGMVYQSAAKMNLKGNYLINNSPGAIDLINGLNSSVTGKILVALLGFPSYIPPVEAGHVSLDLVYPAHFQTGIKFKPFPDMQFNIDVGWTDFAQWKAFNFRFDREVSALKIAKLLTSNATSSSLALPLQFSSPWNFGFGFEYSMTDRLKLRLGYEPRKSAIPLDRRNPMIPINNAELFGTGIGYRFDKDTDIDLTIAFLRSRDQIPANTSGLANKTGVDNVLLNPYAGLDVSTNTKVLLMGIAYRTRW